MDSYDLMILTRLSSDGRLSSERIGKSIGLTGNAVANRIKKLTASGVVEGYRLIPNFDALGVKVTGYHFSSSQYKTAQCDLGAVSSLPYVHKVIAGMNGEVMVFTLSELGDDEEAHFRELSDILFEFELKRRFTRGSVSPPMRSLSRVDLRIMSHLVQRPRLSVSELSKKIGLSTRMVNRRVTKLFDDRLVRFSVKLQLSRLRGYIPYYLFVSFADVGYNGPSVKLLDRFRNATIWHGPLGRDKAVFAICREDFSQVDRDIRSVEKMFSREDFVTIFPARAIYNDEPISRIITRALSAYTRSGQVTA